MIRYHRQGPRTARSAWLAYWSLKPLTPSVFDVCVAGVEGMLYNDCKQAGVIVSAHDDAASVTPVLAARLDTFRNAGRLALYVGNLRLDIVRHVHRRRENAIE